MTQTQKLADMEPGIRDVDGNWCGDPAMRDEPRRRLNWRELAAWTKSGAAKRETEKRALRRPRLHA